MTHQTLSLGKYWKLFPATLNAMSGLTNRNMQDSALYICIWVRLARQGRYQYGKLSFLLCFSKIIDNLYF